MLGGPHGDPRPVFPAFLVARLTPAGGRGGNGTGIEEGSVTVGAESSESPLRGETGQGRLTVPEPGPPVPSCHLPAPRCPLDDFDSFLAPAVPWDVSRRSSVTCRASPSVWVG